MQNPINNKGTLFCLMFFRDNLLTTSDRQRSLNTAETVSIWWLNETKRRPQFQ